MHYSTVMVVIPMTFYLSFALSLYLPMNRYEQSTHNRNYCTDVRKFLNEFRNSYDPKKCFKPLCRTPRKHSCFSPSRYQYRLALRNLSVSAERSNQRVGCSLYSFISLRASVTSSHCLVRVPQAVVLSTPDSRELA